MAVDSYGLPFEFCITGGEVHDSKAAPALIDMLHNMAAYVNCLIGYLKDQQALDI
jgi:hypothetical protein